MKKGEKIRGFSLFELLMASILSSLLMGILLQGYLTTKKFYKTQTKLVDLNENLRFADFIFWQTIMQAGFAGCRKACDLDLKNHLENYAAYRDLRFGIRGYHSDHPPPRLLKNKNHLVSGADIIVVGKASSEATALLSSAAVGTRAIRVEANPITEGKHIVLIADCKNADLIYSKSEGAEIISFETKLAHEYAERNTEVRIFEEAIFFVREHPGEKRLPSLYFCTNSDDGRIDELIPNVSDMKVSYGVDIQGRHVYRSAKEIVDVKVWDTVSEVIIDLKMHGRSSPIQKSIYVRLRNGH